MRLGLNMGYSGSALRIDVPMVQEADRLGFHSVWSAEAYGSDAVTTITWVAAVTQRIGVGTAIMQIPARTPTLTATTAITLDQLSGGRFLLGLGVSGPQVVEGWHGVAFGKPLARTREYVEVVRSVWRREKPVEFKGQYYQIPYAGTDATGLGKPLKPITHPLRADLPIWLGAEGPKNVALTAEIADGWLAIYYTPRLAEMYNGWLDEGFARAGARRSRADFEIAATAQVILTDDVRAELDRLRPFMALYIGGMGAEELNFHAEVYRRMGYGDEVEEITRLFRAGRKDEAAAAVPDRMILDTTIIGDEAHVREQLAVWEKAGVTMLLVGVRDVDQLRRLEPLIRV